jgi:hypothetical protein
MRELLCFSACLCVSVPITFYRFIASTIPLPFPTLFIYAIFPTSHSVQIASCCFGKSKMRKRTWRYSNQSPKVHMTHACICVCACENVWIFKTINHTEIIDNDFILLSIKRTYKFNSIVFGQWGIHFSFAQTHQDTQTCKYTHTHTWM